MTKQEQQDVLNRVMELGDEAMAVGEEINLQLVNGYVLDMDEPLTAGWIRDFRKSLTEMQKERAALEREAADLLATLVSK